MLDGMNETARAFWTVAPGRGELREETLAAPGPDDVVVDTLYSGISRGTESTVFHGRVPPEEYQRMRAPFQVGDFIIVGDFSPSSVLGRIRPGQLSRLRLDGYPWAQYGTIEARVARVGSDIRDNLVRVEFDPEPASAAPATATGGLPTKPC